MKLNIHVYILLEPLHSICMSSKLGVASCKADVMVGTSVLGLLPFTEEKFL